MKKLNRRQLRALLMREVTIAARPATALKSRIEKAETVEDLKALMISMIDVLKK